MMKSIIIASLFLFVSNVNAQTGTASWYGPGFHGKKTASGEWDITLFFQKRRKSPSKSATQTQQISKRHKRAP